MKLEAVEEGGPLVAMEAALHEKIAKCIKMLGDEQKVHLHYNNTL